MNVPTDAEPEQTNPPNDGPEVPEKLQEDPWNSDCTTAEQDHNAPRAFYLRPLRSSEASGYCSLSEEGDSFEFKNNRALAEPSSKKNAANEQEELEYTELLTVV